MDSTVAGIVVISFTGGLVAGMIAYHRLSSGGAFIGYFIFGALLPVIGIIVACLIKPPPQPPSWRPDPWRQNDLRWWDGGNWTHHVSGLSGNPHP